MPDAPGPAPDQAAEALREHLTTETFEGGCMAFRKDDVRTVLAELDRQRALIAAVLAECERRERTADDSLRPHIIACIPTRTIRALLGGEG